MAAPVLGLDIGGSKTQAVLSDGRTVLAEVFAGSANVSSVGEAEAGRQLDAVFAQLGSVAPVAICVGAAGVDSPEAAERFSRLVGERAPSALVRVVHDAELILAAAGSDTGIAVISGTGSVAWARQSDGTAIRAGGWGYLLGDDGSGYGVARDAVRHVLNLIDHGKPADQLTAELIAACELPQRELLLEHFYVNPERRYWARKAGLVFSLAASGDDPSAQIVAAAVQSVAELIRTVGDRLDHRDPVVLAGGLVVHQPAMQSGIREALAPYGYHDIRVIERDPVYGAVALARALL